jgi:hypothetical protein
MLALLPLSLSSRQLYWWHAGGVRMLPPRWMLLPMIVTILSIVTITYLIKRLPLPSLSSTPFVLCTVLFFFSDAVNRKYNLLQGPSIRGEISALALVLVALIPKASIAKSTCRKWLLLPALISLILIYIFFREAKGNVLHSDDHSVFFFRFSLLKEHFPSIPFYSTLWNAGFDARDFFATGALGIYTFFYPLITFFSIENSYNSIVALLLFVVLPCSVFLASYLQGFSHRTSAISSVLSLSISLLWYRWSLKYGTLGFCFSTILTPLNLSLFSRMRENASSLSWWWYAGALVSFTLMFAWSLSTIFFLPLVFLSLFSLTRLCTSKRFLTFTFLLVLINLPLFAMLWKVSSVSSFLTKEKLRVEAQESKASQLPLPAPREPKFRHHATGLDLKKSLKALDEWSTASNPLLILLSIPGFFLFPRSRVLVWAVTLGWLLLLGTVGVPLKPQLELDRMLLVVSMCLTIPVSLFLSRLFDEVSADVGQGKAYGLKKWGLAFIGGVFMAAPLSSCAILANRSLEQFSFRSSTFSQLAESIAHHGGEGRTLFAGFVLHELDAGHLAPLAHVTKKPLMASTFVHNVWWYTSIFPHSVLARGREGIESFLDAFNVTSVVAHEKEWREYFGRNSDQYAKVSATYPFVHYTRKISSPSYIYEGEAKNVIVSDSSISLTPLSSRLILKATYFPFLSVTGKCALFPYPLTESHSLIQLDKCAPQESVHISSVSPLQRLLQ